MPGRKRVFFVDESGDTTFFNKRREIIVGKNGVSNFFFVGSARIEKPHELYSELEDLRRHLLNDTYFKGVPSFDPAQNKTAVCFHAKDDLPEVRKAVFGLLSDFDIHVTVAFRRKLDLAQHFKEQFEQTGKKFNVNDIYDDLVMRIFRDKLHKADSNEIVFAQRGKSSRQKALTKAIVKAKGNFNKRYGLESNKPVKLISAKPDQFAGLQAIDYYLWALQRLLEKRQDRYFEYIIKHFSLVMDLDDHRNHDYGEWYSKANPLSLKKVKPI